jgi:hypothetical protein
MSSAHILPDADFAPAPLGQRLRLVTLIAAVMVVVGVTVALVFMTQDRHPPPPPAYLAVACGPGFFAAACLGARIRMYRLVGTELHVRTGWRTIRLHLEKLQSVTPDPAALRWAWKTSGNRGLMGVAGRFRSKRLGAFRAYLTDKERAGVLRGPQGCVVVSPDKTSLFIEAVRKRAGLSG